MGNVSWITTEDWGNAWGFCSDYEDVKDTQLTVGWMCGDVLELCVCTLVFGRKSPWSYVCRRVQSCNLACVFLDYRCLLWQQTNNLGDLWQGQKICTNTCLKWVYDQVILTAFTCTFIVRWDFLSTFKYNVLWLHCSLVIYLLLTHLTVLIAQF